MIDSQNNQHFEGQFESYLLLLFRKIPYPLQWRAVIIGFLFYIPYFLIALFSGQLYIAFWSRMHLVQISFSICIIISIYLWEKFLLEFIDFIKGLEGIINDTKKYEELVDNIVIRFRSRISFLIPIPLIIISGSYFYFGIYPKLPDNFFPIPALFIYTVSLFLFGFYLLGSKGFWYLYTIAQIYKSVSQEFTIPFFFLLKQQFKKFSDFPFKVSLYLFIIEGPLLPILIYIIYFYNIKIGLNLMILAMFGLFLVISFIICLFFFMNTSIQESIIKSKEKRLNEIVSELEECEKIIFEIKKSKLKTNKIIDLDELLDYHEYLYRIRKEVLDIPEKTSKSVRLFELFVSILPILPISVLFQTVKTAVENIISVFLK